MTVHRNRFLVNKTNRCTEFQFDWYYYSTCFGQPFCPSSGVLSRTSALVHFMQLWPFATRSRMEFYPTPGSKWSQLHKVYQSWCIAKNSWRWAERLPKTSRVVIPIKLEFSASVGFIHKEFSASATLNVHGAGCFLNHGDGDHRDLWDLWHSFVLRRTADLYSCIFVWLRTPDDGQKCCPKHVE
jgi:hypothetical protein